MKAPGPDPYPNGSSSKKFDCNRETRRLQVSLSGHARTIEIKSIGMAVPHRGIQSSTPRTPVIARRNAAHPATVFPMR